MEQIIAILASEFKQTETHVKNVIDLIDAGNTIPFIARYRKEMTGSMDDQLLRELSERLAYLRGLSARKEEVRAAIEGQGKLTEEISSAIDAAQTMAEVEDLYRPYRPKRRTRASIARERGLEPLAQLLMEQDPKLDPFQAAEAFVSPENGIADTEAALGGARDILAEEISDDAEIRKQLRRLAFSSGCLRSFAVKEEDSVYRLYYEFSERVNRLQSHQILAVNRGEREGFLKVEIEVSRPDAVKLLHAAFLQRPCPCADQVAISAEDGYDRLLFPSLVREIRNQLTDTANEQAIHTFALNLKPLLMQPPVKNKVTLGLDPAYRTGCKIAVVDGTGKVLDTAVVYPTPPHNKKEEAAKILNRLIEKDHVQVISIGNGTASRESEQFVAELIRGTDLSYMIVSEAGASVYSASKLAASEFPDYDVSLRSAVSIARRLQDPLAELVKIDPKSIGVGQYQHDMPQQRLDETLGGVVEDCVNTVGVDLNTASAPLLGRVAGINAAVAKNIVAYREENGAFHSRKELLKVSKLGSRTYVQCAGFIRVPESKTFFDRTGVHPESYDAAEKLLSLCGYTLAEAEKSGVQELRQRVAQFGEEKAAQFCEIGVPTLRDIVAELLKPGRDPRDELPPPLLRSDVMEIEDLVPGMELTGTVRNVVDFGAFVDIGVHQDGLVHISRMADRFIRHPSEVVRTGDVVKVWVLEVQKEKNRIALTMKRPKKEE